MPNIGLIVAMRSEVPHVLKDASGGYQCGNNTTAMAVSGIGPQRARIAAQRVCTGSLGFYPDLLINSGFCGAVRNDLDIGHLIIADQLAYRDREIQLENSPVEKVADLIVNSEYRVGKVQTFKRPVLSRVRVPGDTLAVDMESFTIAQTAAAYRIPAIIIKAVSDRVPEHVSLIGLLNQVRNLKLHWRKARAPLSMLVKRIVEDQNLFDWIAALRKQAP